ncbi:MAG: lysozyme inhibitor LprI family protein [Brumimicrobium sp.]
MRHLLTAFFFIIITLTSFSQTQLELNQKASEKYSEADKELNRVYNQILTDYEDDSNFIEKLRISQRLWIKFRDAELEMKFPESDKGMNYGSIYPICKYQYLEQLTNERTEKLMEWLNPIPEGDPCTGSVKFR